MGAKYANLQVQSSDIEKIKSLCPDAAVCRNTERWISVTGPDIIWGTAQKEAKWISKVISESILVTEYFDDDYVEFTIYKEGKRIGRHVPAAYEGLARKAGKPEHFIEAFGLPKDSLKQLGVIFKEQDPEICVRLLECVLQIDLEGNYEGNHPDPSYLDTYLAEKEKKQKLDNRTKLLQVDELPGDFFHQITVPLVCYETPCGDVKSLWDIKEGRFSRLFTFEGPGRVDCSRAFIHQYGKTVLAVNAWMGKELNSSLYLMDETGSILDTVVSGWIPTEAAFLSEAELFYDGKCYDCSMCQGKWDLGLNMSGYGVHTPAPIGNNRYVIVYDTVEPEEKGVLSVFDNQGTVVHTVELPDARHWTYPIVDANRIYMACAVSSQESILTCYDEILREQWKLKYPGVWHHAEPFYDKEQKRLYFLGSPNRFYAVDTASGNVAAVRELSSREYAMLLGVLPNHGVVVMTADTTLEVWGENLATISRHRTKGVIMKMLYTEDKCYLITLKDGDWETDTKTGEKKHTGAARLYELVPR